MVEIGTSHDLGSFAPLAEGVISGDPGVFFEAFTELMLASQQGFALFDDNDRLRFANPVFRNIFGLENSSFPTWADLMRSAHRRSTGTSVETDDFEVWLRSAQSRRGKLPYRTIESQMNDGRWIFTTETTLAAGWMLCVLTDISELGSDLRLLRQERDKALKNALSDELTGLSNRRYLMERMTSKFSVNDVVCAAVIILDIDYFKKINDNHGHEFGDRVLRHFGAVLQAVAGRDDLIGRLGGEEFLLVSDSTRIETIEASLEKLQTILRQGHAFPEKPDFYYTCSAGVSIARQGETPSQVLKRADIALYRSKAEGRDRYTFADVDV